MELIDPLSFWGNALAFVVLMVKTFYDLLINPRQFHRALAKGIDELTAAKEKRKRSDISTVITFFFLAISSAMMMMASVK